MGVYSICIYGHTHLLYIKMKSINAVHDQCMLGWTNVKKSNEKHTDALTVNVFSIEHYPVDFWTIDTYRLLVIGWWLIWKSG